MATDTALTDPADTRIMGIVHSALRRDLARAREALTADPPPFPAQRVALADHLVWLMRFLHQHHSSEDEHLYPLVRERNPQAGALLDRMDADHRSIGPAMDSLCATAEAYRGSDDARAAVVAAVDELRARLLPHLDREETEMMPVVSAAISEAEWQHWNSEHNVKPLGPIEVFDEGLFIIDGATAADSAAITALIPGIPRWLMLHVMIRRYRRAAFRRWRTTEFSPLRSPLSGRQEVTAAASPAEVWALLTDVTRVGEWSHECRRAEWLGATTTAVEGARFRGHSRNGIMRWSRACTFTTVDPQRELAWITHGGIYGDTTEWRFTLEPTDSGTRIVQRYRIISLPVWFDRLIHLTLPAHHDRGPALQTDLVRLAQLAQRPAVMEGS
ncbi:hemerythrin domain-containing protein [Nocardia sp. NPDC058379]|uniref:hemerythrin domain-containing protein n=1 Tax=unclassified Nocardia TaxID=2637762 RepID=UPI0036472A29